MTRRALWSGVALGCVVTLGVLELPYVNWHPVIPPVDAQPLVIRKDAMGDGDFFARRSGQRRHRGIDLAVALNSPVRAIRSGTVVQVGDHRGLGRFIEIEHRRQLRSLYAHLNDVGVEPGARVKQGDVIGAVGKTGNARHPWITPHLHLEVRRAGKPIDPQTIGLRIVGTPHPGEAEQSEEESLEPSDASGGE